MWLNTGIKIVTTIIWEVLLLACFVVSKIILSLYIKTNGS